MREILVEFLRKEIITKRRVLAVQYPPPTIKELVTFLVPFAQLTTINPYHALSFISLMGIISIPNVEDLLYTPLVL